MARRNPLPTAARPGAIRCAVYTRKSTEEGLEQEYNSLDAQFDACAAYIASQRHEGWTVVRERYDDGGFSGGSMERPGLTRLLADVAAGRVQVIVLYKVDRLTRSLADFSKIVEVLDAAGASFVSVTQAFNTTTSMGRLMLNVLLSFAQFEREVTGERIRDKVAASKKKGMWMGGNPPLGYDVQNRKLVVNDDEAATVRHIYHRYVALGTGAELLDELREQGYRTKRRVREGKPDAGGLPFTRGMLFHILKNRIYLGEIVHQGIGYPGEHDAMVDRPLWDAVQQRITDQSVSRHGPANVRSPSLLAGIIRDGLGRRMSPSHANKHGKRYRYYVTHAAELRKGDAPAWRLPAHDSETIVVARFRRLLMEHTTVRRIVTAHHTDAAALQKAIALAEQMALRLDTAHGMAALVPSLIAMVAVGDGQIAITVDRSALLRTLGVQADEPGEPIVLDAAAVRVRRGKDVKLVLASDAGQAHAPDPKLVQLLQQAEAARAAISAAPDRSMRDAATALSQCRHRLGQLVRLSWLAPDIVDAIVQGQHPARLTARVLLTADLPLGWDEQKAVLGFA